MGDVVAVEGDVVQDLAGLGDHVVVDLDGAAVDAVLLDHGGAHRERVVLLLDGLVLGAGLPLPALAADLAAVVGAPQRDHDVAIDDAGGEQDVVLGVVEPLEVGLLPAHGGVCKALVVVGGDVEVVVGARDDAQAGIAGSVEDAGGNLAHAAAELVFVLAVDDDGRGLEALLCRAFASGLVERPAAAGRDDRSVDELAQQLDVGDARAGAGQRDRPGCQALVDAHGLGVCGGARGLDDGVLHGDEAAGVVAEEHVLHLQGGGVAVGALAVLGLHDLDGLAVRGVEAGVLGVALGLVSQLLDEEGVDLLLVHIALQGVAAGLVEAGRGVIGQLEFRVLLLGGDVGLLLGAVANGQVVVGLEDDLTEHVAELVLVEHPGVILVGDGDVFLQRGGDLVCHALGGGGLYVHGDGLHGSQAGRGAAAEDGAGDERAQALAVDEVAV